MNPAAPEPLPYPVVDNHCHLDMARKEDERIDPGVALEEAAAVGVPRLVQVGCDLAGSRWSVEAADRFEGVVAAVALHPNEAPRLAAKGELEAAIGEIDALAGRDGVRAVGETGLDYFRTDESGRDAQHESFRAHIDIAKKYGRTLMIHDREAHDDVLKVIDAVSAPERWVMHCFSGDADFARQCLDRGAYLSFSGTVTFKNAEPLREALRLAPLDRILVETDAPFLAPMPHRGRPNASYLIPLTVRSMAETKGLDLEALCMALDGNSDAAYGGTW